MRGLSTAFLSALLMGAAFVVAAGPIGATLGPWRKPEPFAL